MARGDVHEKRDRLWARYWAIREAHGCGFWTPTLWHLALSGDCSAMVTLADTFDRPGRMADRFSRAGLYRRPDRGGYEYAAQHLAMEAFNRGDRAGYRYWLRRASRFDPDFLAAETVRDPAAASARARTRARSSLSAVRLSPARLNARHASG